MNTRLNCVTETLRPQRRLLTVPQVAEMLGVCQRTLFSLTAPRGPLPAVRIGRRVLYDPNDVQLFVNRCKTGASESCDPAHDE